jgi:DNA-binding NarL/FixJ family response regulator
MMRALIADDHALFRSGVRHLLAQEFDDADVIEVGSLDEALEKLAGEDRVDLLVMDLNMPGVESVESIAALRDAFPDSKIVILSASEGRPDIGAALAAGINGYIPKSLGTTEIIAALREVLNGSIYVPLSITRRDGPLEAARGHAHPTRGVTELTERQRHVLDELLYGKSSKEIARALDIAEGTVKIHLAAIYRALGVSTRAAAIAKVKSQR